MTATIIAFPDALERSDREFARTGSTPWLRAIDEAQVIGRTISLGGCDPAVAVARIDELARQLASLEWRRDDLDSIIRIELPWGTTSVSLRQSPALLRALAG